MILCENPFLNGFVVSEFVPNTDFWRRFRNNIDFATLICKINSTMHLFAP